MDEKLIPAHVLFARWFIRMRWVAIIILIGSVFLVKDVLDVTIQQKAILILAFILIVLNGFHNAMLNRITRKGQLRILPRIKREIHIQIITDLILLTLMLHYSGGLENPLIIFYIFHMIIASSIFPIIQSYLHTLFALLLIAALVFLECYGIIPHYHLEGFVDHDLYQNEFFIFGTGFIYVFTSMILVNLTHMIISRSIRIEENYVRTNQELENKDKVQNQYVLRVTHDIKGHLAAIISSLGVVKAGITGHLNDEQAEFINRAYDRTNVLSSFVRDLLNLTRKRLNRETEFEDVALPELIAKVISSTGVQAFEKSLKINTIIDPGISIIKADPLTMEELISNLLQNAIKYTPPGGKIYITVKRQDDQILTEFLDTGIGIPEEEIPRVFDEFYRASNVPRDSKTGSGLGLSICRQIVENHNGRIWVASKLGEWTKFSFTLPLSRDTD